MTLLTHNKKENLAPLIPMLFAIMATICWAGNITVAKYVSGDVPPLGLSFWRWMVAAIILLPFVFGAMRATWPVFLIECKIVLLLAFLGVTAYNSLIYLALESTLAANVAILQSTSPLMILLVQFLLMRKLESLAQYLAIFLSTIGVLIIAGGNSDLQNLSFNVGDGIALLAILSWAIYSVVLQKLPVELRDKPIIGYTVVLGVMMIFPFYLAETASGRSMPLHAASLYSVTYTGLFASVIAFWCWNQAVILMGVAKTGQFMHCIAIFGVLLSIIILGEQLGTSHLAGIVIIVSSLFLANYSVLKGVFHRTP